MSLKPVIGKLVDGIDLGFEEAQESMRLIMSGLATDSQIGCLLTALRMKGETVDEVSGLASAMREYCQRIKPMVDGKLLDTCGTGGDKLNTFNISTIAAFVAAGAGVSIAKHGNRSVTSKCGSADVLEQLGLRLDLSPKEVEKLIEKVGIGFIYAPVFHPAMKFAVGPRRELGIRTVFNVLGPLTNPANASIQLLGVYSPRLLEPMAKSLQNLRVEEAMVVHGMDGMDEISTVGETRVSWLQDCEVRTINIKPKDFGVRRTSLEKLRSDSPEHGAEIAYKVLVGSAEEPQMDVVLVNSVAGIKMAGLSDGFADGMELARESIESGAAYKKLRMLVKLSGGDLSRLEDFEDE
ncbi:anthranilate phosphoribosyltransferase [Thermoproteota archaeon]